MYKVEDIEICPLAKATGFPAKGVGLFAKVLLAVVITVVVSLALACSGLYTEDAHAASKYKQHKKYEKTIKSYNAKMKKQAKQYEDDYWDLSSGYRTYFSYADIDKNGVDELIVKYDSKNWTNRNTANDSGYNETTTVYTIRKGKVKRVVNNTRLQPYLHNTYVRIYRGGKYIDRGFSHGYEDLAFFKFNKGRLSKNPIYRMSCYQPYNSSVTSYNVNDKSVTAKRYNALKKSLMKKGKGYRMHVYTAKNLKRYR